MTDFSTVLCQIEAVISLGVGEWKLYKLFYYFSSREDANNLLEDIGKNTVNTRNELIDINE